MNRVIRSSQVAGAVAFYGGDEPRFLDEDVTALVERARREGYEQGWNDGQADGRNQVEHVAGRIETGLRTASAELQATHRAAVETTIDAALAVAEFILGRTPGEDGSVLAARIAEALQSLDDQEIVVKVNPTDHTAVADAIELPPGVTLEMDHRLQPGEAKLRGKWSAIDMTKRAALEVVREALG